MSGINKNKKLAYGTRNFEKIGRAGIENRGYLEKCGENQKVFSFYYDIFNRDGGLASNRTAYRYPDYAQYTFNFDGRTFVKFQITNFKCQIK